MTTLGHYSPRRPLGSNWLEATAASLRLYNEGDIFDQENARAFYAWHLPFSGGGSLEDQAAVYHQLFEFRKALGLPAGPDQLQLVLRGKDGPWDERDLLASVNIEEEESRPCTFVTFKLDQLTETSFTIGPISEVELSQLEPTEEGVIDAILNNTQSVKDLEELKQMEQEGQVIQDLRINLHLR
ncbi:MAG: hypothetical protein AB1589_44460 [Cyanobacteriota bacterium]